MKIKMIFDLPEEKNEFRLCQNGADYFCALWDIKNQLWNYNKQDISAKEVLDKIQEIMDDVYLNDIK